MKARIAASVVLAAALVLGTAGCSLIATQNTMKQYDPSDGVDANVGSVNIRNAIVFSKGGISDASLVVSFLNNSDDDIQLTVQYKSGTEDVNVTADLPAHEVTSFGAAGQEKLVLSQPGAVPGTLIPIWFQYGTTTGKQVQVPVLNASQSEYEGLLPTPSPTPTNIPGATLTPTPTPTAK